MNEASDSSGGGKKKTPHIQGDLSSLKKSELFADLTEDELGILADAFPHRRFEANQTIFRVGDEGTEAYLVVDGELQVLRSDCVGGEIGSPALLVVRPGGIVGEFSLVDRQPRSADVVALVDTNTVVVPQEALERIMLVQPRMGQRILLNLARIIVSRTRETTDRLATTLAMVGNMGTARPAENAAAPYSELQSLDGALELLLNEFDKTKRLDNGYEVLQSVLMGNLLSRGYKPPLLYALELNLMGSLGGWVDFLISERVAGRDRIQDFARHLRRAFLAHCEQHEIDSATATLLTVRMANAILGASTSDT